MALFLPLSGENVAFIPLYFSLSSSYPPRGRDYLEAIAKVLHKINSG